MSGELITRQFQDAGFDSEEAQGRAQIAAATMRSLTLRARAGTSKGELQRVSEVLAITVAGGNVGLAPALRSACAITALAGSKTPGYGRR